MAAVSGGASVSRQRYCQSYAVDCSPRHPPDHGRQQNRTNTVVADRSRHVDCGGGNHHRVDRAGLRASSGGIARRRQDRCARGVKLIGAAERLRRARNCQSKPGAESQRLRRRGPQIDYPAGRIYWLREHGGQILLAPTNDWAVVIDGKQDDYRSIKVGEEAVFAFKDERPATFRSFGMLIPRTGRNPKEFELLVSDESPSGPYRTIGTFHPQNVRVMKTGGWQDFTFEPITAKYLKVKLRSNFEEVVWLEVYEFRVSGQ
ncbi:MAG: hypothetical protein ABJA83_15225 [Burkholderiaceae bacterium]